MTRSITLSVAFDSIGWNGETGDNFLLQRVAMGDREAFGEIYRRHRASVYRFARQMGGTKETAEDVTQEVFMALMRGGARFNPRLGTLSTYLYGIARNLIRRRLKQASARVEVEIHRVDEASTPALTLAPSAPDDLDRLQVVETLRRAIHALPFRYREVVVLCELHELRYEEAARIVGCPLGTIRSRLSRARRELSATCRAMKLAEASGSTPAAGRRCLA